MSEIVVLSEQDLEKMITLQDVIPLVEKGFVDYHHGAFVTFPVVREKIDRYKGVFGIKSGYLTDLKQVGIGKTTRYTVFQDIDRLLSSSILKQGTLRR